MVGLQFVLVISPESPSLLVETSRTDICDKNKGLWGPSASGLSSGRILVAALSALWPTVTVVFVSARKENYFSFVQARIHCNKTLKFCGLFFFSLSVYKAET